MVSFTKTVNTSTWDYSLFVPGKEIFTVEKLLSAVTGFTPAAGDVLVIREDDSDKHDRYDFDFYSTSGSATIDTATTLLNLGNTSQITSPDNIISLADSAAATWDSAIGSTIGFVPGVPAYLDFAVTGTAVSTAGNDMTFTFIEEDKNQEIVGIIYDVNDADTSAITMSVATAAAVHYSALNTDGTGSSAQIAKLKELLKDREIETRV